MEAAGVTLVLVGPGTIEQVRRQLASHVIIVGSEYFINQINTIE